MYWKKKILRNINYRDYAKKGEYLVEDVEPRLENESKGSLIKLLSGPTKKKYIDLDLPLIFCLIFCTEIESLKFFRWRLEFNYWLLDTKGPLIHPVSL